MLQAALLLALALATAGASLGVVPPVNTVVTIQSALGGLALRHCAYQLYAFSGVPNPLQDANFTVVAALNGAPGAISLQSVNFPAMYITLCAPSQNLEAGRLCIAAPSAAADASFGVQAGASDPALATLVSLSAGPLGGGVVAVNVGTLTGSCAGGYARYMGVLLCVSVRVCVALCCRRVCLW
jgi:hypothetical protein